MNPGVTSEIYTKSSMEYFYEYQCDTSESAVLIQEHQKIYTVPPFENCDNECFSTVPCPVERAVAEIVTIGLRFRQTSNPARFMYLYFFQNVYIS